MYCDDDDNDQCDHDDADFDILTGRESCSCGWARWLTSDEYQKRAKLEVELMENHHFEMEKYERQRVIAEICLPSADPSTIDETIPF